MNRDREEAIETLENMKKGLCPWYPDEVLDMAIHALQQEPKTGHWIDDEFGSKCSCCGIHTHLDKFDRPMKFKYCSMCGAKMEVEE